MDVHQRWIPRAMLGGAALHITAGLADPRTRELVDAGLVGALDGDPGARGGPVAPGPRPRLRRPGRARTVVGPGDRPPPDPPGEWLAGIGALIVLVAPASGGWLVLALGGWAMWAVPRTAGSSANHAAQTAR